MKHFKQFEVKRIDVPGKFTMNPMELKDFIDWEVKRIYYIVKPEGPTGAHCHLEEKELFVLLSGSATLVVDKGEGLEEIAMTAPNTSEGGSTAFYIGNYVWHHFKDLSDDAVLLALSSTNYNPDRVDYIEDYDEYLKVRDEKLV